MINNPPPGVQIVNSNLFVLVLFNYTFYYQPVNPHFFRPSFIGIEKYPEPKMFGLVEIERPVLVVQKLELVDPDA